MRAKCKIQSTTQNLFLHALCHFLVALEEALPLPLPSPDRFRRDSELRVLSVQLPLRTKPLQYSAYRNFLFQSFGRVLTSAGFRQDSLN